MENSNKWRVITFISVGICIYLISFFFFQENDLISEALSGIALSCIAGVIISYSIDLQNVLKGFKQSIIDTITSHEYLNRLETEKLALLRTAVTEALYANHKNRNDMNGLVKLDQEICTLLQKPYYNWYRQTIICAEETKEYIKKQTTIEYEIQNPYGQNQYAHEDIGLSIFTNSIRGIENDKLLKIETFIYKTDNDEIVDLKNVHNFITECPSKDERNYKYQIRTSKDKSIYAPYKLTFKNSIYVRIIYQIYIPITDIVYSKRLRYPTKSFVLNYSTSNNKRLRGELIGTLTNNNDYSITGNDTNQISIESRKWLLPKNGAVIIISPKKTIEDEQAK